MRRVPTGKRPQLNQGKSGGWSWPRLVPIQEQQGHAVLRDSSSMTPGSHSQTGQSHLTSTSSKTNLTNPTYHSVLKSPIPDTTTESALEEGLAIQHLHGDERLDNAGENVSPMSGPGMEPIVVDLEHMPGSFDAVAASNSSLQEPSGSSSGGGNSSGSVAIGENEAQVERADQTGRRKCT